MMPLKQGKILAPSHCSYLKILKMCFCWACSDLRCPIWTIHGRLRGQLMQGQSSEHGVFKAVAHANSGWTPKPCLVYSFTSLAAEYCDRNSKGRSLCWSPMTDRQTHIYKA